MKIQFMKMQSRGHPFLREYIFVNQNRCTVGELHGFAQLVIRKICSRVREHVRQRLFGRLLCLNYCSDILKK